MRYIHCPAVHTSWRVGIVKRAAKRREAPQPRRLLYRWPAAPISEMVRTINHK